MLKEHTKASNKLSIDQSKYKVELLEEKNAQLQDEMTRQGNTLEYKYEQMARRFEGLYGFSEGASKRSLINISIFGSVTLPFDFSKII